MRPKVHGLSAPWAAGVRKRLSPQSQADFKSFFGPAYGLLSYTPMHLVYRMPGPKNVQNFLDYIEAIPDAEWTRTVHNPIIEETPARHIIQRALDGEPVGDAEVEEYRKAIGRARIATPPSTAEVRRLFKEIEESARTKKRWLSVMREYYSVFFAEEEVRLAPVLQKMLEDAQALSETTNVTDLIERLSNGYTVSQSSKLELLVLVPSVWLHPFVIPLLFSDSSMLLAWGAHPGGYRLAPGEVVPDQALLVLRALADPTRLRLLRLLTLEPRTPQALSRELKLTLPTVSHHMRELRVAGLVRMEAQVADKGRENRYTVRWGSADKAFNELSQFVMRDEAHDS